MVLAAILASSFVLATQDAPSPETHRVEQVREASKDVMPFDMGATQHVFRKTDTGGIQSVVTRAPNARQTELIRQHLRRITDQFNARDFAGPAHIHGASMPGLEEMRASRPADLSVAYSDIDGGGQITYVAKTPGLIDAVHRWFDAQVADHGADAQP